MTRSSLVLLLLAVCSAECSKILVVFPVTGRSHYILGNALARGLVEAGHDVTMVSAFEDKNPPKGGQYKEVILTGFLEKRAKSSFSFFDLGDMNPFFNILFMNKIGDTSTRAILDHPNFQKLLKSNEKFDAVIIQQFLPEALKALAYHFNAPLIVMSTLGPNSAVNNLVANPAPPSYVPDVLLSYGSQMTFKERLVNWLFTVANYINYHLIFYPAQSKLIKEYFPPGTPDLTVINYNVSLILLNNHESINQAVPHVPNMIDIGGYHLKPSKKLPQDLQDFMDSAKEGVVYFSLGSNIKPSQMTDDKREAILRALGKIKQKVLWKWDEDTLPGKPSNVKISKWFPQQDILAHPNTQLFITHGGLLSTIETVYHGVPVLAFPVFGDQKMNAAKAVTEGYGLSLPFSELIEVDITNALNKLLNYGHYKANVQRRSQLMHDRAVKPMDLATYWIEFVIRHGGAPHLRVAGVDLPWYKYLLLDVISFVILVSIIFISVIYFIVKKLCCAKKNKDKLKKN